MNEVVIFPISPYVDPHRDEPIPWMMHPNLKRKLPLEMTHSSSERLYNVSLYSGLHIPDRVDIQEQLDFISTEHENNTLFDNTEKTCDDSYSYSSYVSYLVETSIINDEAIENRYIGLMDIPEIIEYEDVGMNEGQSLSYLESSEYIPCHDDKLNLDNENDEFSTLWNKCAIDNSLHPIETTPSTDIGPQSCLSSFINVDNMESIDERICQCDYSQVHEHLKHNISTVAVEERQDVDHVLSISLSGDYSTITKTTETSSVIHSLKEKKRRLESRFMKNDLHRLDMDRVEVVYSPCSKDQSSVSRDVRMTRSDMKNSTEMKAHKEDRSTCMEWCGLFSTE